MDTPCHSSWCSQSCGAAVVVLVLMLLGLGGWPGRVAASSVLLTLDVPTATQLYGLTTFVAINDPGQILGYDLGTSGTYLLTNPAAPIPTRQAIACPGLEADTAGEDVNRYGEVAGRCGTSGFVLTRAGVYRLLVYPGLQSSSGTWATALNNRRQVVGSYELDGFWHGFRWEGGRYTTLDVPFPDATQTFPTTINHEGDVAGYYFANHPDYPGYGKTYGFIVRGGVFEQIEVPHPSVTHTWIWDINDLGHVLGRFHAEDATTFLASDFILIDGTFYYATLPGPPHVRTSLTSINNRFQFVGGRELLDPLNPGSSYQRGVLSTWDRREAPTIGAPAAGARTLRQEPHDTPGATPEADCQALTTGGVPRHGKHLGMALVCGH